MKEELEAIRNIKRGGKMKDKHKITKIIGFKNGNKIISTDNPEKLKGMEFDNLIIHEETEVNK